ncbi:efflux RND transporter periplasmic adaptor subunit [Ramlibacter tataouinensis]|uniref:efflux RND transporter periplasmic adaptor subunit n=1 Tax=Ramlibacter tataouinensis TaxID=94132 RepID=UPI0022F3E574|nr:efflux RND transporter periplasmic adaptor subunit [Ramlibacter tataouinensis]WBY03634.1 efflux RND transporter periplasmic adaptor subunit [Ramlibacter tataouinensis]
MGAAVLGVLLLGAGIAWMRLRAPAAPAVPVQAAPLLRTLQFSARVATLSRVDVGATLTGRVAQVLVREGDAVRSGQVLVRLESEELRAALAQAEANERQAQARLAGLRSTGRVSADAALAQAEATLSNARAELARARKLVDDGFISASRLDDAQRAVAVAQAQQQAAQAQQRANADAGTDVAQAQAQQAVARAATAAARARLEQADIVAPADARVLSRQVEPGQIVQPGKALLGLALAGPTQLVAQVDERFLDQLAVGQPAAVVADAFPSQRFAARVLSLAPAVDPQRGALEVKFALVPPAPEFLREDMTLSVEVETGRRERALVLPLAALRGEAGADGSATVLVVQDDRARERAVQLGLRTLDAAEVVQGLAEGELVLLGPDVKPESRVRAQASDWKPRRSGAGGSSRDDPGSTLGNLMGR